MKKIKAITLGCSKNRVDTEHILAQLKDEYTIISEEEDVQVDYLLLNTCGFIGDAKEESINTILGAVEKKRIGQIGTILVFGCLSQRYMAQMPKLIPEVDYWFGARDFSPVIKALGCRYSEIDASQRYLTDGQGSYAYLKISEGCDRRCSYCAIPFIRGVHKSVPIEELVKEARELAVKGVKELIIIAQDTTYYGLDIYKKRSLAVLLEKLSEIPEIKRLRIHYSYPTDFPEDVLEQMAVNPKICRYMDIPLQHISDNVLNMMHRHIDGNRTKALIAAMREKVPGVVLRTTMIVGHPGETDVEFEELLEFVREAKFERLGAFTYSEEEGTYDAKHFKDVIPENVKHERLEKLMTLQSEISANYNQSRVGKEYEVLVDYVNDDLLVCRSEFESPDVDGEILVKFSPEIFDVASPEKMIGKFFNVRITGAYEYDLIAEPILN